MNTRIALISCILNLVVATSWLNADLLDFEGLGISPGDPIPQSYGDTASVDISHRQLNQFGPAGAVVAPNLGFWSSGYGDLNNLAYGVSADATHVGEVRIAAVANATVTLDSFEVGDFRPDLTGIQEFLVFDGSWNVLFSQSLDVSDTSHDVLTPSVSADTLVLQWGYPYHIGIDNIAFNVNAVPEPTGVAFWALGIVVALGRQRRGRGKRQTPSPS